jgi:hypothetical protein
MPSATHFLAYDYFTWSIQDTLGCEESVTCLVLVEHDLSADLYYLEGVQ